MPEILSIMPALCLMLFDASNYASIIGSSLFVRPRTDIKLRSSALVRARTDIKLQLRQIGLIRSYKDANIHANLFKLSFCCFCMAF